jgi:hypothetical protein
VTSWITSTTWRHGTWSRSSRRSTTRTTEARPSAPDPTQWGADDATTGLQQRPTPRTPPAWWSRRSASRPPPWQRPLHRWGSRQGTRRGRRRPMWRRPCRPCLGTTPARCVRRSTPLRPRTRRSARRSPRPAAPAAAPFAMSATRTAAPHRVPSTVAVLKAPGLPLPAVRRSVTGPLASRAATSADGIVPIRYPASAATKVDRIDAYADPRPAIIGTPPRRGTTGAKPAGDERDHAYEVAWLTARTECPGAMSQTARMRSLRSSRRGVSAVRRRSAGGRRRRR